MSNWSRIGVDVVISERARLEFLSALWIAWQLVQLHRFTFARWSTSAHSVLPWFFSYPSACRFSGRICLLIIFCIRLYVLTPNSKIATLWWPDVNLHTPKPDMCQFAATFRHRLRFRSGGAFWRNQNWWRGRFEARFSPRSRPRRYSGALETIPRYGSTANSQTGMISFFLCFSFVLLPHAILRSLIKEDSESARFLWGSFKIIVRRQFLTPPVKMSLDKHPRATFR